MTGLLRLCSMFKTFVTSALGSLERICSASSGSNSACDASSVVCRAAC